MTGPLSSRAAVVTAARPTAWYECGGCGWKARPGQPVPLACPAARAGDDVDHVLVRRLDPATARFPRGGEENPFLRYRTLFHAWHAARRLGWSDADYVALVERLDVAVAAVDGHGFRITPFMRSAELSERLGFRQPGGVWVKDETGNVSGSHKARHLMGTLIELEVAGAMGAAAMGAPTDPGRARPAGPPLAIASCGNAALAAAVVARAAGRPLDVYIPVDADPAVVRRLDALGARLAVCEREDGTTGDPTVRRLLDAVAAGALPFTCQGNLNAFAVQGGQTIAWEMVDVLDAAGARLDRTIVQVGGGALASAVAAGFEEVLALGRPVVPARLHAVQTGGAYPLARAHQRLAVRVDAGEDPADALAYAAHHRGEFMWPWETPPHSIAHGILDDETYDWLAVSRGMLATGGYPVVVDEATLLDANELARDATGIDVDHTGSAGLAGLLHLVRQGGVYPDESVAVIFSGARRGDIAPAPPPTGPGHAAPAPSPTGHDAGPTEDPRS